MVNEKIDVPFVSRMDAMDEQTALLREIVTGITGKTELGQSGIRFLYCEDSYQTTAKTFLSKFGIYGYIQTNALQTGLQEFIFSCNDDIYSNMTSSILNYPYRLYLTEKRLTITSSIGSVSVTVSDAKVASTDNTPANVKYIKCSSDGTLILPSITGSVSVTSLPSLSTGSNTIGNIGSCGQTNLYGFDGSAWQSLQVDTTALKNLKVRLHDGTNLIVGGLVDIDGTTASQRCLNSRNFNYGYNGTNWDRLRVNGNKDLLVNMTNLGSRTPAHTAVSVGNTSTSVLASNANRKSAIFINDSNETIYLNIGGTASMNTGIRLNANGGAYEMSLQYDNLSTSAITGICTSGSKNLLVTEYT